jgi:hypothetical protein
MKVCAVHWQRELGSEADSAIAPDDSIDTLHVVARTLGASPTYYYRALLGASCGNGGSEWTPWGRIDLDILGDGDTGDVHMLLTTFNRRLYLFWAQFVDKPEPKQPGNQAGDSPPPALTHWEIRMAWSTYRDGTWSAKQISSDAVISNRFISSDPKDLKAFKGAVKEFESRSRQAHSKFRAVEAIVLASEAAMMVTMRALFSSARAIWKVACGFSSIFDDEWATFATLASYASAPTFPALEAMLKGDHTTFEKFVSDTYDQFNDLGGGKLTPAKSQVLDSYDALQSQRKTRDDAQAAYQKLAQAVKDFKSGKSDLAVPDFTRRTDHSIWLSSQDGVDIYVMRHDEATNPLNIGVFSLSDDGRSVSADGASARLDISRQIPHHSEPEINHFTIETAKHPGLDLEGMNDLLGKVHGASFTHERWLHHPVTAESMRPFFIAKRSEVHVALPHTREIETPRWQPAASTGRFGAIATAQASFGIPARHPNPPPNTKRKKYLFEPFHHPFTHDFLRRLERDGVDGLLTNRAQNPTDGDGGDQGGHFDTTFAPKPKFVGQPYAAYDVDFRHQGPYSLYNWELFFHAPHLIASRLMTDGRYEDARRWLHYIFDPTTPPSRADPLPQGYWKLQWFRDHDGTVGAEQLMTALATNSPDDLVSRIQAQIEQWHEHPADPHRIAALRTSAYRKAIVFKYLDNLIAWADSLFAQNTIETINQATQLYVLAAHLLGPRPEHVPQQPKIAPFAYHDLRGGLDDMSDMLAIVESAVHPHAHKQQRIARPVAKAMLGISHLPVTFQPQPAPPADGDAKASVRALCFCVPANPKIQTYFDTIDDRLFKIRNCMNIEGVVEQLPLFDPPIDPALLVRAAAMGLDLGSILSDLGAPLPFHRFNVMVQKATDVCNDVKSLGAQLLAALEKKDAEVLAALRASHETAMLEAIQEVKKQQLQEAKTNQASLESSREVTQKKHDYYASRDFINPFEVAQLGSMGAAAVMQFLGGVFAAGAASSSLILDMEIGPTGMGAHATAKTGGTNAGNAGRSFSEWMNMGAQALQTGAQAVGILGGYERRQDEWTFQKELAQKELAQIDKQIAAAEIRVSIAERELANQQLQIDHSKKIEETLRTKYTNADLYQWMITQISSTYYQAYKLAYDLAKRAERCYRYELGVASSSFIQFGHWDSLHRGLYAGEALALDLKRLEAAYLAADRREYEITRQISLVQHDPSAFIGLRENGTCIVDLPEELFDADYPGHYFRRLKTVSLTLPCVAGPYTPINCTLTLLESRVRTSATPASKPTSYPEHDAPNDARFSHAYGAIQSVATSHGQSDAGLFEVGFRDERYLPFEGAGAVSRWRIDLPRATNAFDFDSLSDVVFKISYTARDGGAPLAHSARQWLQKQRKTAIGDTDDGITRSTALGRLFRVRHEMSDEWIAFRNALAKGPAALTLPLGPDRFPYLFRGSKLAIVGLQLFATTSDPLPAFEVTLTPPGGDPMATTIKPRPDPADATILPAQPGWPASPGSSVAVVAGAGGSWSIAAAAGSPLAQARDLLVVATYTAELPAVQ